MQVRLAVFVWCSVLASSPSPLSAADDILRSLGLALEALSEEDLEEIQGDLGQRMGVRIAGVTRGSPAAKAGLKKGDILLAIGMKGVDSPRAVEGVLAGKTGPVEVLAVRPGVDEDGDETLDPVQVSIVVPPPGPNPAPEKPAKGPDRKEAAPPASKKPGAEPALDDAARKKLEALEAARAAGIIDDEEYARKRSEILGKGPEAAPRAGAPAGAYDDPGGRFRIALPPGWSAEPFPGGQGAVLSRGDASLSVMVLPGSSTAAEHLESILRQVRAQWKEPAETRRGEGKAGGRTAPLVEIAGVDPKGAKARARLLALVEGGTGFVLLLSAPAASFDAILSEGESMLASFEPGRAPPAQEKGKVYRHPIGFSFWHPEGWTVKENRDFLQVVPPDPGTSPQGPTELHFVIGESVAGEGIGSADDPRVVAYMENWVRSAIPALVRKGKPGPVEMARGKGISIDWEGKNDRGDPIRARALVAILRDHGVALVSLGLEERMAARDAVTRRIFASFGLGESQKDPALVGSWLYEKNFWAGTYSSTTSRTLALSADGTFSMTGQFFAAMDHTDGGGDVTGRTGGQSGRSGDRGRWGAAGGKLYLFFDDSSYSEYTYHVEDQSDGRVMLLQTAGGDKALWSYRGR